MYTTFTCPKPRPHPESSSLWACSAQHIETTSRARRPGKQGHRLHTMGHTNNRCHRASDHFGLDGDDWLSFLILSSWQCPIVWHR